MAKINPAITASRQLSDRTLTRALDALGPLSIANRSSTSVPRHLDVLFFRDRALARFSLSRIKELCYRQCQVTVIQKLPKPTPSTHTTVTRGCTHDSHTVHPHHSRRADRLRYHILVSSAS
jgi:hypothetical protein